MSVSPSMSFMDEPEWSSPPLSAFHLFSELHTELRCIIWALTLPGPRFITPFRNDYFTGDKPNTKVKNPIALQVCQESRALALRHYQTWTNAKSMGYQYVDFVNDAISFNADSFALPNSERAHIRRGNMSTLLLPKVDRHRIQRIELRFSGVNPFGRGGVAKLLSFWAEHWLSMVFPAAKEVEVVIFGEPKRDIPGTMWMTDYQLKREVEDAGDEVWEGLSKVIEKNMETQTVLVVEYGPLESNPDILLPAIGLTIFTADMYNYTSIPQPGMNNQTAVLPGGAIVGGGSAVNSMFFDRGSAEDYDNWEKLSNPGWGWDGILPYFKKSVTFTPPSVELQTQFNITYNLDAYGGNGSVQSSFPPYQWGTTIAQMKGWKDFGIPLQREGANGNAHGLFWIPASLDPKLQTRSYSRTAHYDPYTKRANYHLLTEYHANIILFTSGLTAGGIQIQPRYNTTSTPKVTSIFASREVILAAGSIVTTNPYPNHDMLISNATFLAEALNEYHQNKTGPITGADGDAGVFLPLQIVSSTYKSLINKVRAQSAADYLPADYDPLVIKGFEAQREILLNSYASNSTAVIEVPLTGRAGTAGILLKPLSRGSINIDPTNPNNPIIDFSVLKNPVDLKFNIEAVKLERKVYSSPGMASLGPVETAPGANVTTDDEIAAWIHKVLLPSASHPCGTAAMMPREIGGVVGPDLLVHGVKGLSVVDASIMPLIPGTHLSATVYAVAEKSAEIIKARADGY
ncbi:hypothetical protein G7Y89_g12818 [Cudoniella acicularis]|uniref:Glucose-methanol-choline oxidoreductase N-terminal domain-containing protein n=1 Tax=Cudoniella acicularis TaxID=354080 RepID=A0A8H4VZA4_9HELO|nr:hypothetical protein G7Y89_g12818 [Cudoniella acicularis]